MFVINSPVLECSRTAGTVSAEIEQPAGSIRLWFSLPRELALLAEHPIDAFVAALVLPAMRARQPIHARGCLSLRFLKGLLEYQRIFHFWLPELQVIAVTADKYVARVDSGSSGSVGSAFSGGVDSFFTLFSHLPQQDDFHHSPVSHLVFVHGLDIPLTDVKSFEVAKHAYEELSRELGLQLVPIATNIRQVTASVNWELTHGSALAAVGHCLTGLFRTFLIPATHSYDYTLPWGSDFRVDHLLSTESLQVLCDGSHATRTEKVRAVAGWPQVHSKLRVCWESSNGLNNCGTCDKCIRTQTALELLGVRDRFVTFPGHYEASLAGKHTPLTPNQVSFMQDLLAYAQRQGRRDVSAALRTALRRAAWKTRRQVLGRMVRRLREKMRNETRMGNDFA